MSILAESDPCIVVYFCVFLGHSESHLRFCTCISKKNEINK